MEEKKIDINALNITHVVENLVKSSNKPYVYQIFLYSLLYLPSETIDSIIIVNRKYKNLTREINGK